VTRAWRTLAAVAALAATAAPGVAMAGPPVVDAPAAAVVDARDGTIMYSKQADERRAIASTTKLMTALLVLERGRPGAVYTAPRYDAQPAESRIGLAEGERMTASDLLEALLLESANDAAVTLARGVSGSTAKFVAQMNERAAELGLRSTRYANPVGLDDPGGYSTARDLATLTVELMERPRFARIVDSPRATLASGARPRVIENRNRLIAEEPWVDGVKTGHTERAGYVLVGTADGRGEAAVVSVVLGDPSEDARDADSLRLLRWGLGRFRRVAPVRRNRPLARADVRHRSAEATLVPRRGVRVTLRRGQRLTSRVSAPEELDGPLPAGRRVGSVTVLVDGRPVDRVAVVTADAVPGAGAVAVVVSTLGVPLTLLLTLAILLAAALTALRIRVRLRLVR